MERNKRTARTLTAALCLALLAGCGAETAGESLDADEMHPGWSTVTTDPSAYGITYQELEDLSGMPLDQLTAYCLGADGVYGENGFDQLYHRFLEAPDTVLSYLALIDSREERELFCDGPDSVREGLRRILGALGIGLLGLLHPLQVGCQLLLVGIRYAVDSL